MAITDDGDRVSPAASEEEWAVDKREFVLDERERLLDRREVIADQRDAIADERERQLDVRARALDLLDTDGISSARAEGQRGRADAATSRGEARRLALAAVEIARSELAASQRVPPLLAQFAVLAQHLHGSATIDECLDDILQFTDRIVSAANDVTIATFDRAVLRTRAATSEIARMVDQMQHRSDEGPSFQAVELKDAVVSGDLSKDDRWPAFGPLAHGVGILSALSVCIHLGSDQSRVLGSINHYSTDSDAFDRADEEMAIVIAAHAAVALDSVRTAHDLDTVMLGLRTRDVIGQAKGILMERGNLTADQAFDALRTASNLLNRRLAEIAAEVSYSGDLPQVASRRG
jgi:hypothetical protein